MAAPIRMEPITALGRSRCGFLLSPPSWTACSKPRREKTMPPPGMPTRIAFAPMLNPPEMKNPPPALKLPLEHEEGEHGNYHLPCSEPCVQVGQPADTHQVEVGEHEHEHDGGDDASTAQSAIDGSRSRRLVPVTGPRDRGDRPSPPRSGLCSATTVIAHPPDRRTCREPKLSFRTATLPYRYAEPFPRLTSPT
jgi:hypothetical protein